jgi:putative membrane protein
LLILPLFSLILIAPPALGAYSATRTGTALPAPSGFAALPTADPVRLSVADYASRAVYDHGHSLGQRQITVTGFIGVDDNAAPYLMRMILSCCAGDAQPVKIGLIGQIPPVLQPDTWFDLTGTYTAKQTNDPINGGAIPYLNVSQARPVPTSADPYDPWGG